MSDFERFLDLAARHLAARSCPVVLYTDLDGTLLGPGGALLRAPDGSASARAADALVAAARGGLTIVPVSGRQRWRLQEDARLLGLGDCIGEAGAAIVRDGVVRYLWGECPVGLGDTPHDAVVASGALGALLERFGADLRLYEPWHRDREGSVLLHGRIDVAEADAHLARAGVGWARVVDNGAAGGWPGREVRAYHLLARGIGKAAAVRADRDARGLTADDCAAVGDSPEDATIAEVVGTYFEVVNGSGATGALTTPGAMGEGFAQAVDTLLAVAEARGFEASAGRG